MEVANHFERQGSVTAHHFVNPRSLTNDAYQRAKIFARLFQSEFYGIERIGQVDRVAITLVRFN